MDQNVGTRAGPAVEWAAAGGGIDRVRIGVVVPCFRVTAHILDVIAAVGPEVTTIYAVDDSCPDGSGDFITANCDDARVVVLRRPKNGGVGAATATGVLRALADGVDVVVKLDGDGQMDPALIPIFCAPILSGDADYTKGNRFFNPENVQAMPAMRVVGNAGLSFLAKASSGYWSVFDPTNGYFAMHRHVARALPWDKIASRYFFESDLLFRLGTLHAVVLDVPMRAVYEDEESGLNPLREIVPFAFKHVRNGLKRIFYSYFLRNFNAASMELLLGIALFSAGSGYGLAKWTLAGEPATSGTVMVAALPVLAGFQLILAFLNFDVHAEPRVPIHPRLARYERDVRTVRRRRHA